MADWTDGFDAFVAPHDRETFLADIWEKQAVHLRHGADFVDGLFDLEDLDEQLTGSGLRYPTFRLLMQGRECHPDTYTHRSLPWGTGAVSHYVDYMELLGLLRQGATVVLEQHQRTWAPLAELVREVELVLGVPTQVNTYMTPAGHKGLLPHYDLQDVFVVQTAGRKHWWVHAPHVALPVAGQECPTEGVEPGELLLDVVLEPGDVLYMPRGFVHHAESLDETSLHSSVSAKPQTWLDVLGALVDAAREDVRMRRGLRLDLHGPNDAGEAANAELQQTLRDLAEVADLDGVLDRMSRQVARTRMPLLSGVLADLARVGEVDLDSELVRRDGIVWRAEMREQAVQLSFHGRTLSLPWHAIQTARFLGESGPFAVRDVPGELNDQERVHLCGTLVSEGFLTFAD